MDSWTVQCEGAGLGGCRTRGLGDSRCEPCLPALARDTAGGRAAAGLKGRARHRQAGAWMSRGWNAAREGHQAERRAQVSREGLRDILAGLRRACLEAKGDERASSRPCLLSPGCASLPGPRGVGAAGATRRPLVSKATRPPASNAANPSPRLACVRPPHPPSAGVNSPSTFVKAGNVSFITRVASTRPPLPASPGPGRRLRQPAPPRICSPEPNRLSVRLKSFVPDSVFYSDNWQCGLCVCVHDSAGQGRLRFVAVGSGPPPARAAAWDHARHVGDLPPRAHKIERRRGVARR